MIPIKHLLHINSPVAEVFKAISDEKSMSNWYTTMVSGKFEKGSNITFEFVDLATFKFKIIKIQKNEFIHIQCVESEWYNIGHNMKYDLDENGGKTRLRYTYEGFTEMDDLYSNMNYSSGKYLESLRQYCQNGRGEAFGSLNYRS
jgi:uncharacterized protein YndB with AHSA1/START domain